MSLVDKKNPSSPFRAPSLTLTNTLCRYVDRKSMMRPSIDSMRGHRDTNLILKIPRAPTLLHVKENLQWHVSRLDRWSDVLIFSFVFFLSSQSRREKCGIICRCRWSWRSSRWSCDIILNRRWVLSITQRLLMIILLVSVWLSYI